MNKQTEIINQLTFENYIWIIYVVIAIGNIVGDELIKKSISKNDKKADTIAKNIFTTSLIITIIIYIYFLNRNYKDIEKHNNSKEYKVRYLGSILTFIGLFCFLYFQIKITTVDDTVSSI